MTAVRLAPLDKPRRLALAATVAVAIATMVALLVTSASAQSAARTLTLVAHPQRNVGFAPRQEPHPGDSIGFGEKISGDDTGFSRAICTIVGGNGGMPCTIWVKLSHGTLTLQGLTPERAHNTPIAITGGTGAYNGARGTARVTDVTQSKTRIVVTLLG